MRMPSSSSAQPGAKDDAHYLGRVTRDIVRKIKGDAALERVFGVALMLARRVREQRRTSEGRRSIRCMREVECIGKGKAHRPYELA